MADEQTENWNRLKHLFEQAVERAGTDRAEFVRSVRDTDTVAAAELERLLAAHDADDMFLETPAAAAWAPFQLSEGARLGPYSVVSFLGSGGMGEVYRVRDVRTDHDVALKLLPPDVDSTLWHRRFEREARILSRLSHPAICAVHEWGEIDGRPFLAMEFLEGSTLEERLSA